MRANRTIVLALAMAAIGLLVGRANAEDAPKVELHKGDRIIIIGNTLAERMQHFGHFETLLHSRFPELELIVHNLGWSADELTLRPRSAGFKDHGHELTDEKPDVLIAAFGFNESFGGPNGLPKFEQDLERFIERTTTTKYNGKAAPGSCCCRRSLRKTWEPARRRRQANNENLKLYTAAMAAARHEARRFLRRLVHADPRRMSNPPRKPLTINGVHLNDYGYQQLAIILDEALFGQRPRDDQADLKSLMPRSRRKISSSGTTIELSTAATSTAAEGARSGLSTSRLSSPSSAR